MRTLIIENNKNDLMDLIVLVDNYNEQNNSNLEFKVEYNYEHILQSIHDYDFVFMDIELDCETNGIDLACKIREYNKDIKIIFMTNYKKYLIDGYKAKADLYLLKPISQNEFNNAMDDLSWSYIYNNAGIYDIRYSSKKIYFHNILYLEKLARKLYIHFKDGSVFETSDTLLKWKEILKDCPFSSPHRSFFVNMEHIDKFDKKAIKLESGQELPITEIYFDDFYKDYIRYLNRRK